MKFGIIAALDQELALITRQMAGPKTEELAGIAYYQGKIADVDVVAAVSSVGKVNAAICATLMADHFGVDRIINVGIAGAVGQNLKVMDVVLSGSAMYHDGDAVMKKYFPFTDIFEGDKDLLALAQRVAGGMSGVTHHTGRIATGDVFVSDRQTKQNIVSRCAPLCVEMEGAAIAHVAHTFGLPFLIIRTMSDSADEQAEQSYDNFIDEAAAQSAAIVLGMIAEAGA